jgi:hypothetical protein
MVFICKLNLTKKFSGQFKASRFLRSKKARLFKLRADLGVIENPITSSSRQIFLKHVSLSLTSLKNTPERRVIPSLF